MRTPMSTTTLIIKYGDIDGQIYLTSSRKFAIYALSYPRSFNCDKVHSIFKYSLIMIRLAPKMIVTPPGVVNISRQYLSLEDFQKVKNWHDLQLNTSIRLLQMPRPKQLLKSLLSELHFPLRTPPVLRCDNVFIMPGWNTSKSIFTLWGKWLQKVYFKFVSLELMSSWRDFFIIFFPLNYLSNSVMNSYKTSSLIGAYPLFICRRCVLDNVQLFKY